MSTRSLVAAVFAGALMMSSAAMADPGGHGGGGHDGGHHDGGRDRGGWGGHSSVFIGGDFGYWPYGYGYWPGYYYDYPPPVVYAPPPVAYYPPPAAYAAPVPAPAPAATAPAAQNPAIDQSYCRQYQGTVMVDGATQPSSGVACRQPDGTWRIIQ